MADNALKAARLELARRELARRQQPETSVMNQAGSGVNEGLADILGFPVDMMTGGLNLGGRGLNSLLGTNIGQIERPVGGSESLRGLLSPLISEAEPQTRAQSIARRAGYEVGTSAPLLPLMGALPGPLGQSISGNFKSAMAVDAGGGVGAALAGQAESEISDNPTAQMLARMGGGILGGLGTSATIGGINNARAVRNYVKSADSSADLSKAAKAKYEEGHSLGLKVKPVATRQLDARLRGIATDEGLITPTGRVAENADVRQIFTLMDDFQAGPVSTKQLQAVRRRITALAGSPDKSLSRVGVQMKRAYDEFLGQFAPQFKEANELNRRAMLGEMMDRADELADVRASQFSQSGQENALRTEYAGLDRDIAKGRTKGLRPDQIEAVQRASRGTPAMNTLRGIGKMAPRGVISGGFHSIPFMAGNAIGGPGLGMTMAGGTMAAGTLAHAGAGALRRSAANQASAAMRQAAPMAAVNKSPGLAAILAMIQAQAATAQPR